MLEATLDLTQELDTLLDRLDEEDLATIFELMALESEVKREEVYGSLLEQTILLEGKKGRGKTLTGMAVAWQLRERFGRPVITVGSKMGLKPEFGPHQDMTAQEFRDELAKIDIAASEEENADLVAQAFAKYGISILYATILFDEAYKLMECQSQMDKLIRLIGYFIAQSRHYHVTIIIMVPQREQINKRVLGQVDWFGRCYHNKYTNTAVTRLIQGLTTATLIVDGLDDTEHTPYYDMYLTKTLLGYRQTNLQIGRM